MPGVIQPVTARASRVRRLAAVLLVGAGALLACERQPPQAPAAQAPVAVPEPSAAPEAAGPLTREQFEAMVESARACAPGDTCALAGGGACLCAQPVNASRAAELDAAAARVECGGAVVRCMNPGAARCEAGRCVGFTP